MNDRRWTNLPHGREGDGLTWKLLTTPRFRTTRPLSAPKTADTTYSTVVAHTVTRRAPSNGPIPWQHEAPSAYVRSSSTFGVCPRWSVEKLGPDSTNLPHRTSFRGRMTLPPLVAGANLDGNHGEGVVKVARMTELSATRRVEDACVDEGEHEGWQHAGDDQDNVRIRARHPRRLPARKESAGGGCSCACDMIRWSLRMMLFRHMLQFYLLASRSFAYRSAEWWLYDFACRQLRHSWHASAVAMTHRPNL